MIINEELYLEHYGVQGMKWGARRAANRSTRASLQNKGLSKRQAKNTTKAQNRVDKIRMAATGRQGKVSVLKQLNNRAFANTHLSLGTVLKHPLSTKKAATLQLQKNEVKKEKILNGQKRVTATLLKIGGVSIKDIDFTT